MAKFLNTTGNSDLAVFICDRCRMKRPHSEARNDPNSPGLLVCGQGCADEKDPYRLAARQTERITIRFPRPDASVVVDESNIITVPYGGEVISPEQNTSTPENNGNLDGLST